MSLQLDDDYPEILAAAANAAYAWLTEHLQLEHQPAAEAAFAIAEAIRVNLPPGELRRLAVAAGFHDMLDDGADKILAGVTTAAEVLRSAGARKE